MFTSWTPHAVLERSNNTGNAVEMGTSMLTEKSDQDSQLRKYMSDENTAQIYRDTKIKMGRGKYFSWCLSTQEDRIQWSFYIKCSLKCTFSMHCVITLQKSFHRFSRTNSATRNWATHRGEDREGLQPQCEHSFQAGKSIRFRHQLRKAWPVLAVLPIPLFSASPAGYSQSEDNELRGFSTVQSCSKNIIDFWVKSNCLFNYFNQKDCSYF